MPSNKIIVHSNYILKKNVSQEEHAFMAFSRHILGKQVPKILNYNSVTLELKMAKINGMSLADMYGETDNILSNSGGHIYNSIRVILEKLWDNGILYRDVTPYNFLINNDGEIFIIDFEHAILLTESKKEKYLSDRKFVSGFIKGGIKHWNRNFK